MPQVRPHSSRGKAKRRASTGACRVCEQLGLAGAKSQELRTESWPGCRVSTSHALGDGDSLQDLKQSVPGAELGF